MSNPQQGVGSHPSPSLCLAVTLASIRSLGHLVAWCGLGPAPEISWACQLDPSVCRAIRALCHLPPPTPAALALLTACPRARNDPGSSLCRQHSLFPIQSCRDGAALLGWLHTHDLMAQQKENIWSCWIKKVTVGMHTHGGCPLFMGSVIDAGGPQYCRHGWHCPCHPSWPEGLGQSLRSVLNETQPCCLELLLSSQPLCEEPGKPCGPS